MVLPWAYRKMEAVAAHGSNSLSEGYGVTGVVVLMAGRLLEEDERCLASCPADMAKASLRSPARNVNR